MKNKLPNWDLKAFYKNINDPKIEKDKKETLSLVEKFNKTYRNKINSPKISAKFLLKAIEDYEKFLDKETTLSYFSSFLYSTNTDLEANKKFYQEIIEFQTLINTKCLWFDLELIAIDNKIFEKLIKSPILKNYKYYLNEVRKFKPYFLSEKEEQILTMKSQTSGAAFVRLYDETSSNAKYELNVKGRKKNLTNSEVSSIMKSDPDRSLREKATISYSKGNAKDSKLYTFILNTLLLDKKIKDEIRGYKYPEEATFLDYNVNEKIVKNMSDAILEKRKIVEKYYLAKKKILKLKELHEWDRYSNIYEIKERKYSWDEAKDIILSAFKEFSNDFYEIAKMFFDKNWIDAQIKPGKRSGAFCSYGTPSTHPMVLLNYTGELGDIATLAHELGHGIHAYLSRKQKYLEYWPSTATAEIASTFAENMVFKKIYENISDKKEKVNVLGNKIQDSFATIFRQNDFYLFEKELHKLRREKGEIPEETLNNIYQNSLQKTFGSGLTLTPYHKNFWIPISHFYHYNFYVFTYSFGELLAISLLAKYKKDGEIFTKKYIKALSAGGSISPKEILDIVDVDIDDKNFWQNGLGLIEEEVEEFLKLSKQC